MKKVRIYKDNIREHILRSLLFTDTVIFIGGAAIIAILIYVLYGKVAPKFDWGIFISITLVTEILFLGAITFKIDNQPIFKLIPRIYLVETRWIYIIFIG